LGDLIYGVPSFSEDRLEEDEKMRICFRRLDPCWAALFLVWPLHHPSNSPS